VARRVSWTSDDGLRRCVGPYACGLLSLDGGAERHGERRRTHRRQLEHVVGNHLRRVLERRNDWGCVLQRSNVAAIRLLRGRGRVRVSERMRVDLLAWAVPNSDSQTVVCEAPCRSDGDCELIYTACIRGVCSLVPCGPDAGNGSTCAMGSLPATGTCSVAMVDGELVRACTGGGTSDGGCLFYADTRSQLAEICPPGYSCLGDPLGDGGSCLGVCDNVTVFCPTHFTCQNDLCYPDF
jgi:hypothetical protein